MWLNKSENAEEEIAETEEEEEEKEKAVAEKGMGEVEEEEEEEEEEKGSVGVDEAAIVNVLGQEVGLLGGRPRFRLSEFAVIGEKVDGVEAREEDEDGVVGEMVGVGVEVREEEVKCRFCSELKEDVVVSVGEMVGVGVEAKEEEVKGSFCSELKEDVVVAVVGEMVAPGEGEDKGCFSSERDTQARIRFTLHLEENADSSYRALKTLLLAVCRMGSSRTVGLGTSRSSKDEQSRSYWN